MLDACGAYDAAFDAYAAANRASRACAPAGAVLYDRRQQELFVDRLIAAFPRALPRTGRPAQGVRPIFICGMFRSGSTLTEQVLAGHSQVTAGGEIDFVPELARTALAPFPERMAQVTSAQLEELAGELFRGPRAALSRGRHVTDKRPDNFLYVGLIKSLFPDAKIVHTTRNPLDTCLSVHFLHLDHAMGYALDLMDTAHYYRQYRRLMAHWKSLYGADILDFDYDTFVRDPRPADRAAARFLRARLGRRLHGLSPRRATRSRRRASGRCASRSTSARRDAGATTRVRSSRCGPTSATCSTRPRRRRLDVADRRVSPIRHPVPRVGQVAGSRRFER